MYYYMNSKNTVHSFSNYRAIFRSLSNGNTCLKETYGSAFGGYWLWIQIQLLPSG